MMALFCFVLFMNDYINALKQVFYTTSQMAQVIVDCNNLRLAAQIV